MKVKDLERTANVVWSPAGGTAPIHLAAGTAAAQLDASFSTSAALEVYALNLADPGSEMALSGSVASDQRFHRLLWGRHGADENGTIIGGCDNGIVKVYSAAKVLANDAAGSMLCQKDKHTGPVHALDLNRFQTNLLATGAAESEIYIWDLNNMNNAMTPGVKSQPPEDVLCIQWNKQVPHIMASSFTSKCVVWDLRKNEPIIKLTDAVNRIRWKVVAWHPEVATQLCLASEEDQSSVVQLWDLRFATAPLRTLGSSGGNAHQRGVLAMAWSARDPDLLLTAGKDNRLLCWNPNYSGQDPNGDYLGEVTRTSQWCYDIAWCDVCPTLIACPCYDGHVAVYSLMGGKTQQIQTTNKIADSFPGMDAYAQAPVQQEQPASVVASTDLARAPKWMKRPVGATFGFGGKLISFDYDRQALVNAAQNAQPGEVPAPVGRLIYITQVVTEHDLITMSNQLEEALQNENYIEYCRNKADESGDQHKRFIWHFLKANFEQDYRSELLDLLGYNPDDVNTKLYETIGMNNMKNNAVDNVTDQFSNLNRGDYSDGDNNLSSNGSGDYSPGDDSTPDQFSNILQNYETKKPTKNFKIQANDQMENLIIQSLLLGNIEAAAELSLKAKRYADALIIAKSGGTQLFEQMQNKYLQQTESCITSLISALVTEDWTSVVEHCDVSSWREALAAALSHTTNTELPKLCELMGQRLEEMGATNAKYLEDAQLCYICAGSFDKLVSSWISNDSANDQQQQLPEQLSTGKLQELVELVMFLQKAIERQGRAVEITGQLAALLARYASLLASQGCLAAALNYVLTSTHNQTVTSPELAELRDGLQIALGQQQRPQRAQIPSRTRHSTTGSRSSFSAYPSQMGSNAAVVNGTMSVQQQQMAPPPSLINSWQTTATTGAPPLFGAGSTMMAPPTQAVGGSMMMPVAPLVAPPPPAMTSGGTASVMRPSRPPSVGSTQGSSIRSKYVLDPSVQMMQPWQAAQYSHAPLSNNVPQLSTGVPPVGSFTPYSPQAATTSMFQPPVPNSSTNPGMPPPSMQPQPIAQSVTSPNQMFPTMGQRMMNGSGTGPYAPEQQSTTGLPPPPMNSSQGWNDPPSFSKKLPSKSEPLAQQVPLTHPIFGSAAPPSAQNDPYQQQYQQQPLNPMMPPSQLHASLPSGVGGQGVLPPPPSMAAFQTSAVTTALHNDQSFPPMVNNMMAPPASIAPYETAQEAIAPARRNSAITPAPKAPIPEEHIHLQTVFDELRSRCSQAANNPQVKRKIDEVSKKLDAMYDLLREHRLSPNTLTQLHDMIKYVQNGDYHSALNVHMQLVSGPDFSQIASFMPGIKVLLQCAMQLQVYVN